MKFKLNGNDIAVIYDSFDKLHRIARKAMLTNNYTQEKENYYKAFKPLGTLLIKYLCKAKNSQTLLFNDATNFEIDLSEIQIEIIYNSLTCSGIDSNLTTMFQVKHFKIINKQESIF
jgi:hypothetical protein